MVVAEHLLTATAVGERPHGFVGLIVPHVLRMLVGPDTVVAAGPALGGYLVVVAEPGPNCTAPTELPVGLYVFGRSTVFSRYHAGNGLMKKADDGERILNADGPATATIPPGAQRGSRWHREMVAVVLTVWAVQFC